MESSPVNVDSSSETSDKKESKDKGKKSAKAEKLMGAFAVKPETKRDDLGEKTESWWSRLTQGDGEKEGSETAHDAEPAVAETLGETEKLDELTPDETRFIESELVRTAGLEVTPASAEPEEVAAAEKVQEWRQRVAAGEDSSEVTEALLTDLEPEEDEALEPAQPLVPENEVEEAEATPLEPDTSGGSGSGGRSGSGGGGQQPPTPPGGTPPSPPPMPPAGAGGGGNRGFNVAPPVPLMPVANPNMAPAPPTVEYYDSGNPAAAALVGGIIGYLIGRRRGRIKTEKKLLPIQKKLRKEVANLQSQLQVKEAKVRAAARDKARIERLRPVAQVHATREQTTVTTVERPVEQPLRTAAPEAKVVHAPHPAPERIGHVLVTAEAAPKTSAAKTVEKITSPSERKPERPASIPETTAINKHFETLNRAELLKVSEKVIVNGTSLRQIYENRLVSERGLRRLVAEHFRGGDLKRALRREIVEHEIDFERDPVMRDHVSHDTDEKHSARQTPASLQTLLSRAEASMPPNQTDSPEYYQAQAEHEASRQAKQQHQQRWLDTSMAATIAVLLSIIMYLLLSRH